MHLNFVICVNTAIHCNEYNICHTKHLYAFIIHPTWETHKPRFISTHTVLRGGHVQTKKLKIFSFFSTSICGILATWYVHKRKTKNIFLSNSKDFSVKLKKRMMKAKKTEKHEKGMKKTAGIPHHQPKNEKSSATFNAFNVAEKISLFLNFHACKTTI